METGYAIAVAFSDALAYDRATCGKTCKSSQFALATAQVRCAWLPYDLVPPCAAPPPPLHLFLMQLLLPTSFSTA